MAIVFLINHSAKQCGVQQYGKRIANIITKSKKYNIFYYEIDSADVFLKYVESNNPQIILYNNLDCTMPWLTENIKYTIKQKNILQGSIVHNKKYFNFDFYFHQDPNFAEHSNEYSLLRPIIQFDKPLRSPNKIIKIGSFGFGFKTKYFDEICNIVNEQFDEPVQINLHLTYSHFCPNHSVVEDIKNKCFQKITKSHINLNFTHNFLTDDDLLNFLSSNDLNIFLHEKYQTYEGISSSTDFGLAAQTPMAICKSNMFSHFYNVNPSILIEDNSLKTIIKNGFQPLSELYNKWSNDNFIKKFEKNIEQLLK